MQYAVASASMCPSLIYDLCAAGEIKGSNPSWISSRCRIHVCIVLKLFLHMCKHSQHVAEGFNQRYFDVGL
jgi:hypothetical protein